MTRLEQLKEELKEAIKHETPDWFYGNPYLDKLKYAIKKEEEIAMKNEEIKVIIEKHQKYLRGEPGGQKASIDKISEVGKYLTEHKISWKELMEIQEQPSQLEAMKAKEPTSEKTVGDKPLEKDFER